MGKKNCNKRRQIQKTKKEPKPYVPVMSPFGITNNELLDIFFEEEDGLKILDNHENGYETERDADDESTSETMLYLFSYKGKYGVVSMPGWDGMDYGDFLEFFCYDTKEEAEKGFESMKTDGVRPFMERVQACKKAVGRDDFYIKDKWGLYNPSYQIFQDRNILLDNVPLDPNLIRETLERYTEFKKMLKSEGWCLDDISKNRAWNDNQRYFIFSLWDELDNPVMFKEHIPSRIQGCPRCSLDFFPIDEFRSMVSPERKKQRAKEKAEEEKRAQEWERERTEYLSNHRIITKEQFRSLCGYIRAVPCDGTLKMTKKWIRENMPEKEKEIIKELEYMGGYCDCEVLMNCSEYFEEK